MTARIAKRVIARYSFSIVLQPQRAGPWTRPISSRFAGRFAPINLTLNPSPQAERDIQTLAFPLSASGEGGNLRLLGGEVYPSIYARLRPRRTAMSRANRREVTTTTNVATISVFNQAGGSSRGGSFRLSGSGTKVGIAVGVTG